ncbi:MAG: hypothetical protein BWY75_02374 [bacterium ADurb.Bin425]|nr:MAG: hypothetical protein BWY75_02374 [bacterium ADurb.Bin425]
MALTVPSVEALFVKTRAGSYFSESAAMTGLILSKKILTVDSSLQTGQIIVSRGLLFINIKASKNKSSYY